MCDIWKGLGVVPADILLPRANQDPVKWGVVACDQFTSDQAYWQALDTLVGDAPSALRITFPEIYLGQGDEARIQSINARMNDYLSAGIFTEYKQAIILSERTLANGEKRTGLVMAFDLEQYDYAVGSTSLIRATEGTILNRLPPRISIRQNAPLELPHIMILLDDPENLLFGSLKGEQMVSHTTVYDTPLSMGGGHLRGRLLSPQAQAATAEALRAIANQSAFEKRNGLAEGTPMLLYAMGDGNHSLACAKACWGQLKPSLTPEQIQNHPARFALAELVNLYDASLVFEPIHRVVFGVDADHLLSELDCGSGHAVTAVTSAGEQQIHVHKTDELPVGSLQNALDAYLEKHGGTVDYIHEPETVHRLGAIEGSAGFLLPEFKKEQLFPAVILGGALPRKTFSMGEGRDKRYYFEARRIR